VLHCLRSDSYLKWMYFCIKRLHTERVWHSGDVTCIQVTPIRFACLLCKERLNSIILPVCPSSLVAFEPSDGFA
jgi:hypothetical protein